MKRTIAILALMCTMLAHADERRSVFCAGFSEGFKSIKGKNVQVPFCPYVIPQSSDKTIFQEGIKAGVKAAQTK